MRARVFIALVAAAGVAQAQPKAPAGPMDLTPWFELADYYSPPVYPKWNPKTGFTIGGKNETATIRKLTEINGRSIADLERDMRPGAKSEVGSDAGFLGKDEKLIDILVEDNKYVVDDRGLTHQELARAMHALGAIAMWQYGKRTSGTEVIYRGRRFKTTAVRTRGTQSSPFLDGIESGDNVTVENVETGKKLEYALLVPHLIERYGFYEGHGTRYRVEPAKIVELFDFIGKKPAK